MPIQTRVPVILGLLVASGGAGCAERIHHWNTNCEAHKEGAHDAGTHDQYDI